MVPGDTRGRWFARGQRADDFLDAAGLDLLRPGMVAGVFRKPRSEIYGKLAVVRRGADAGCLVVAGSHLLLRIGMAGPGPAGFGGSDSPRDRMGVCGFEHIEIAASC